MAVRLLLTLILLGCPYICLGQLGGGAVCADSDCSDACPPVDAETGSTDGACCEREKAAGSAAWGQSVPPDDPATPPCPKQCLCEGALAIAEGRLTQLDDLGFALLPVFLESDRVEFSSFSKTARAAIVGTCAFNGREIWVRDCALLI